MRTHELCNRCNNPEPDFYPSNKYTCKDCLKKLSRGKYVKKERKYKKKSCRVCGTLEGLARAGKHANGEVRYENICVACKVVETKEYAKEYQKSNRDKINKQRRKRKLLDLNAKNVKQAKQVVARWLLETEGRFQYSQFMAWLVDSDFAGLDFDYDPFFLRAGFDGERYLMHTKFEEF